MMLILILDTSQKCSSLSGLSHKLVWTLDAHHIRLEEALIELGELGDDVLTMHVREWVRQEQEDTTKLQGRVPQLDKTLTLQEARDVLSTWLNS